jgi:hypothetical protein
MVAAAPVVSAVAVAVALVPSCRDGRWLAGGCEIGSCEIETGGIRVFVGMYI